MTADAFADLLRARRVGRYRWHARCPAHSDRHPSLSITQGYTGVLLRCWSAGCTVENILAALKLPMSDLFEDRDLTPAERAEAARQSRGREQERKAAHHAGVEHNGELYRLECLMDVLGAKLACNAEDWELGRLFHRMCDRLHEAEAAMPCHDDGPLRLPQSLEVPGWIHASLAEIGRSFNQVKGPLDAGLEEGIA